MLFRSFIRKLKEVENGEIDQHAASVHIGQILKEMYIDSALKREEKHKDKEIGEKKKERKAAHNIGWDQFKKRHL